MTAKSKRCACSHCVAKAIEMQLWMNRWDDERHFVNHSRSFITCSCSFFGRDYRAGRGYSCCWNSPGRYTSGIRTFSETNSGHLSPFQCTDIDMACSPSRQKLQSLHTLSFVKQWSSENSQKAGHLPAASKSIFGYELFFKIFAKIVILVPRQTGGVFTGRATVK